MIITYLTMLFAWIAINLAGVMLVVIAIALFILGALLDAGYRARDFVRKMNTSELR